MPPRPNTPPPPLPPPPKSPFRHHAPTHHLQSAPLIIPQSSTLTRRPRITRPPPPVRPSPPAPPPVLPPLGVPCTGLPAARPLVVRRGPAVARAHSTRCRWPLWGAPDAQLRPAPRAPPAPRTVDGRHGVASVAGVAAQVRPRPALVRSRWCPRFVAHLDVPAFPHRSTARRIVGGGRPCRCRSRTAASCWPRPVPRRPLRQPAPGLRCSQRSSALMSVQPIPRCLRADLRPGRHRATAQAPDDRCTSLRPHACARHVDIAQPSTSSPATRPAGTRRPVLSDAAGLPPPHPPPPVSHPPPPPTHPTPPRPPPHLPHPYTVRRISSPWSGSCPAQPLTVLPARSLHPHFGDRSVFRPCSVRSRRSSVGAHRPADPEPAIAPAQASIFSVPIARAVAGLGDRLGPTVGRAAVAATRSARVPIAPDPVAPADARHHGPRRPPSVRPSLSPRATRPPPAPGVASSCPAPPPFASRPRPSGPPPPPRIPHRGVRSPLPAPAPPRQGTPPPAPHAPSSRRPAGRAPSPPAPPDHPPTQPRAHAEPPGDADSNRPPPRPLPGGAT